MRYRIRLEKIKACPWACECRKTNRIMDKNTQRETIQRCAGYARAIMDKCLPGQELTIDQIIEMGEQAEQINHQLAGMLNLQSVL